MAEKKSSIFKNTLILVLITLVAIAALAVVNQITMEPIAQAEADLKTQAYQAVFPNAASFETPEGIEDIIAITPDMLSEKNLTGCTIAEMLFAKDAAGNTIGCVVSSTSPNGYGGEIKVAVGIDIDSRITGFTVISNSETAGLGSKCTTPEFQGQFVGKPATMLSYTKSGAASDTEIDAISGATITTNAVTEAVNSALTFYQQITNSDTVAIS